jgi:hypothetical protein
VLLKQAAKLVLKFRLAVMCFLVLDIPNDLIEVGGADAERSVSLLPGEVVTLLAYPFRGIGFQEGYGLREREFRREEDKKVNVVSGAANRLRRNFMVAANSAQIFPHARLPFLRNGVATILGAENEMDMNL